jgi:lipid-binding SYLF domain-containing protein
MRALSISVRFDNTRAALLLVGVLLVVILPAMGQNRTAAPMRAGQQSKKAADFLEMIMAKPEERIPRALISKVEAIAVFNDVKNVGLLIDSFSYGRGVVSRRLTSGKWSLPAYCFLRGASFTPQLKTTSFSVVILFMNDKATGWLLDKKGVAFERDKAPVAGPVGEIRTDQREVVPVADAFSYVYDDGRLQGQDLKNLLKHVAITYDNDLNKKIYKLKVHELLSDLDGSKVGTVSAELTIFPQTVERLFARD